MKVNNQFMKKLLEDRLDETYAISHIDQKENTLRVEDKKYKKGVTLSLPGIIAKYETKKEEAIDEVIYYVRETIGAMRNATRQVQIDKIFPVIRSTSFLKKNEQEVPFLITAHTAETTIYYAEDMGATYRLLDESVLSQYTIEEIKEVAYKNLLSLPVVEKKDEVVGNIFYFLRANDGYDASRILNIPLLESYQEKVEGSIVLATPHQDVLIIADIRNELGYDIMAQITINFFTDGLIPITSLSFLYENGALEPIFVLGKNYKGNRKDDKQ